MKKLLLSVVVLSSVGAYAQNNLPLVKTEAVGINEDKPRATLDVNGDARLQELDDCKNCKWVLVQDEHGVVQRLPISNFIITENSAASQQVGGTAAFNRLFDNTVYVASFNYGSDVNYQEVINSTEIPVTIVYNASEEGNIKEKIILAEENPNLKLKILAKDISKGEGMINAVLYSEGSYNVPQVSSTDFNQNIFEKDIASFKVKVKGVTTPATVRVKAAGIPDLKFNTPTEGTNKKEHRFIYLPVQVTGMVDGQPYNETWLNNDLGAAYANVDKEVEGRFNPARSATSPTDVNAYGNLFQWGRLDDTGYELLDWSKSGDDKRVYTTGKEWKSNGKLKNYTDPCPTGYRRPTGEEWEKFHKLVTGYDSDVDSPKMWEDRKLRLTAAGYRDTAAGVDKLFETGEAGYYWSSDRAGDTGAWNFDFNSSYSNPTSSDDRKIGFSIRCLKKSSTN